MRLKKAKAHNFLTFKDFEYVFQSDPLLVQGENLTDDGQKSNGSGKSSLQTIIGQCMTATNSRGVKDAELVRYGEDFGNIQLYAECDVRKEELHIDYDIYVKGSNKLRLHTRAYSSDDWTPVKFSNMAHGKKFIQEWFAIESEDLFNYYIIDRTRFKSFFNSSNTEKVALINRFSDASIIDGIENVDTSEIDEAYRLAGNAVSQAEGKIAQVEKTLKEEKERDLLAEKSGLEKGFEIQISDILEEIELLTNSIPEIRAEKAGFEKTIKDNNDLKPILEKKKSEIDTKVESTNKLLTDAQNSLKTAKSAVESFTLTDWKDKRAEHKASIDALIVKGKAYRADEEKAQGQKAEVLQIINNMNIALGGAITCPSCSHEFIIDGDLEKARTRKAGAEKLQPIIEQSITDIKADITKTKDQIAEIEKLVSSINASEKGENDALNLLKDALNSATKNVNSINSTITGFDREYNAVAKEESDRVLAIKTAQGKIDNIEVRVGAVQSEIDGYNRDVETLKMSKANVQVQGNAGLILKLEGELKTLNKEKETADAEHNRIGDELFLLNQWSKNFKGFKTFIANKSLEVIEYHCNRYLNEMGSDLIVKIDGFKVLADGSVKDEIAIKIIRQQERSFNSFSGGERGRLLFSSILANRFMINESHPYGGLDFLAIDEVFEGVDSEGIVSLVESAKLLSIPVLIITHVSVDEEKDYVMTITKTNNISTIKPKSV